MNQKYSHIQQQVFKLSHVRFYKIRENNCIALYKHYNNIISSNDRMLKCLSRMKFPYGTDTHTNDGWALGTQKSDDPGQIIATLVHYLHLCTHKYL